MHELFLCILIFDRLVLICWSKNSINPDHRVAIHAADASRVNALPYEIESSLRFLVLVEPDASHFVNERLDRFAQKSSQLFRSPLMVSEAAMSRNSSEKRNPAHSKMRRSMMKQIRKVFY